MRQFDQLRIALNQCLQRSFVRITNHRDQHTLFRFNGEADINGRGMDNLMTDQPARGGAVLREMERLDAQVLCAATATRATECRLELPPVRFGPGPAALAR